MFPSLVIFSLWLRSHVHLGIIVIIKNIYELLEKEKREKVLLGETIKKKDKYYFFGNKCISNTLKTQRKSLRVYENVSRVIENFIFRIIYEDVDQDYKLFFTSSKARAATALSYWADAMIWTFHREVVRTDLIQVHT